jgi:DNA-binding transcriptional ArsR family regulator
MVTGNVTNGQIPEGLTAVFKALADPNRLRIFAALRRGPSCNCWLASELGLPANLVSHHLKALRVAGLVQDRRDAADGRWIYYQADVTALTTLHPWLVDFFDPAQVGLEPHFCGPEAAANNDRSALVVSGAVMEKLG